MKRQEPIIKGTIMITDDINLIYAIPDRSIKILSLDEEGKLNPQLPNVVKALCLLPPVETLIAESDGNEDVYDISYYQHLNSPFCQQFMGAIIAYLYQGGSFVVFAPQLRDTISILKMREKIWVLYGIGMGIYQTPTQFELDYRCIPIWLNLMYDANVLSPYMFLQLYPQDAQISQIQMQKLIIDLAPYAASFNDAVKEIEDLRFKLRTGKPLKFAIHSV